ncbi:MAG: hypothetical protein K6F04_04245 [bacterium]|nr:hypothetical protein [bacterium]
MENKFHNIKVYQVITFLSLITIACLICFIPLHRANNIKQALYKARYNQIKYLNEQSQIIPQTINIIKGHIIHNEKALKDIVYINMLTKIKSNNIKDIYENQVKLFSITKNLIDSTNSNSMLNNNENFKNIKTRFEEVYSNMTKELNLCKTRTKHLQKYMKLPIYKNIIDTTNINEIICID